MVKHNKTGRSKTKLGNFVPLEHYMLDSPAWQSLSPVERSVYIVVARNYNGVNNGRIAMSGRRVHESLPIAKATATRALAKLCDVGFLTAMKKSGFNVKSGLARATEYRINVARCNVTGEPSSKQFMRWHPKNNSRPHHAPTSASSQAHKTQKEEFKCVKWEPHEPVTDE